MLYWLVKNNWAWLDAHHLRFMRVFGEAQDPFRQTMAIVLAFAMCILLGPRLIGWLRRQKIADQSVLGQGHAGESARHKDGTPTMGGVLIIAAVALATLLLADLNNFTVRMALVCLLWLGAVGMADDWLKLTAGRRAGSRQGLTSLEKLLFQLGLAILLCAFTYWHGRHVEIAHTLYFPFLKGFKLVLGPLAFVVLGTLVITGSSNAVNLTDGLDGLATGCVAIVSFAFMIVAAIADKTGLAQYLFLTHVQGAGDMAVIAAAISGACMGFLWFNCHPASVFMGDTGSLALGGMLGYISIVIRQEILLFMVGGIFVLEAISVILQVSYFKYSRRRWGQGRRIFLCSPIHHHFRLKGWTENQVVVRFWLIGAMLAAMALATIKLR